MLRMQSFCSAHCRDVKELSVCRKEAREGPEFIEKNREASRNSILFVGLRDAPRFFPINFGRSLASFRQIFARKKHTPYRSVRTRKILLIRSLVLVTNFFWLFYIFYLASLSAW